MFYIYPNAPHVILNCWTKSFNICEWSNTSHTLYRDINQGFPPGPTRDYSPGHVNTDTIIIDNSLSVQLKNIMNKNTA